MLWLYAGSLLVRCDVIVLLWYCVSLLLCDVGIVFCVMLVLCACGKFYDVIVLLCCLML